MQQPSRQARGLLPDPAPCPPPAPPDWGGWGGGGGRGHLGSG
jgi:hypothetical protein